MCLYLKNTTPMIASQDIPVLKYLDIINGQFITPYQYTSVEFGKKMTVKSKFIKWNKNGIDKYGCQLYSVGAGVIHARIVPNRDIALYCKKAIIPKGTKFWIDSFGNEIAAETMIITKESVNTDNWVIPKLLAQIMLKSAPENNGIYVGDFQLTDDSFVSPSADLPKDKIRGQVCGFYKNGSPIICGLEKSRTTWDKECRNLGKIYYDCKDALQVFNGREITAEYRKWYAKDKEFKAFHLCSTYREEYNEEWFFGSLGEVAIMLNNSIYLNAARAIARFSYYIIERNGYHSCSESINNTSITCYLDCGRICLFQDYKKYYEDIVPFFAFKKKSNLYD